MDLTSQSHTYREIISQDRSWAATLTAIDTADDLRKWISLPREEIIFTGCGSTYYLSLSAAAIWQTVTGTRARGLPASEIWLFPQISLPKKPNLLVAVSRSAETTETLRAVQVYLGGYGNEYLVVTCYPDRSLAKNTPYVLAAQQAEEESVAQTRSFSSMLLATQIGAGLASSRVDFLNELKNLPGCFNRLISAHEPLAKELANDWRLERYIFLGSGVYYGLACEAMLKMKEMSLTASEAYHFLEFRHGPKSIVTPETVIVGLLSDSAREEELKVLAEMRQIGATVLAIGEGGMTNLTADHIIELESGMGEISRCVLYLPVLQLIAFYRAAMKGLNPDRPLNLDAVVRL